MTATYESIATNTLTSSTGTISFTSIPATYTDLKVTIRPVGADGGCRLRFNGDTGNNYAFCNMYGTGSSAATSRQINVGRISLEYNGMNTTVPSYYTADIFNYAGTVNKKTVLGSASEEFGATAGYGDANVVVGLWNNTSAITQVDVWTVGTAFQAGTMVTIYGIKAE